MSYLFGRYEIKEIVEEKAKKYEKHGIEFDKDAEYKERVGKLLSDDAAELFGYTAFAYGIGWAIGALGIR